MSLNADSLSRAHQLRLDGRFEESRKLYEKSADPDSLVGAAMALRGLCRYKDSLKAFNTALRKYLKSGDIEGEAFARYGRGGVFRYLSRYGAAFDDLVRSLEIAPDAEAEAFTRMAIGGALRMIGENQESLVQYTEARRLAGKLRNRYAMAYADCGIGNAFRMLGDLKPAMRSLKKAEEGYAKIGDIVSRPYTLFGISMIELAAGRKGRIDEAEKYFRKTKDHRGLVYVDLVKSPARAAKNARKLGLRLEEAHARFIARGETRLYRTIGAPIPNSNFDIP